MSKGKKVKKKHTLLLLLFESLDSIPIKLGVFFFTNKFVQIIRRFDSLNESFVESIQFRSPEIV